MRAQLRSLVRAALGRLGLAPLADVLGAREAAAGSNARRAADNETARRIEARLRAALAKTEQALGRARDAAARHHAERDSDRRKLRQCREQIGQLRNDNDALRSALRAAKSAAVAPADYLATVLPIRSATASAGHTAVIAGQQITASPEFTAARSRWTGPERPSGIRQAAAHGLVFSFPQDDDDPGSLSHRLARGWLPFEDLAAVRQVVVGGVMVDVGANVGTTCIPRVALGDFAAAYAAEPAFDNYQCLVGNVLDNGLASRVVPDRVAISSTAGDVRLRRGVHIGTHRLAAGDDTADRVHEVVPALTLDDWLDRIGAPVDAIRFVKVDTQGWDAHVLAGAPRLRQRREVVWQVEVSLPMMQASGYAIADFIEIVQRDFTHLIDMAVRGGEMRPSSELPQLLATLPERRRFTNLLLLNADASVTRRS